MPEGPSHRQLLLYAVAVVLIAALGLRYLDDGPAPEAEPAHAAPVRVEQARPAGVTVHVAGAVRRPGVYRLKAGARVDDAVREAGGATGRADLGAVNLAAKVQDGRQVLVPERAPVARSASAPPSGAGPATAAPSGGGAPGRPVNLNTATLEQLDTLPGVGPATAQRILAHRDEHGGFGSVEDLAQVPGIGDKRLATLRELVGV